MTVGSRVYRTGTEARYPAITQRGTLKPTQLVHLLDEVSAGWWRETAGLDRWSYFERHRVRAVVRYVQAYTPPVRVLPGAPLDAELAVTLGVDRRGWYGGHDELTLRDADGTVVAVWTSRWTWLDAGAGARPTPRTEAPPGFGGDSPLLPELPRRPRSGGTETAAFTFSDRETDLNDHVFFACYLERGENALADAGVPAGRTDTSRCWYLRPAQAGQSITPAVTETAHGHVVELRFGAGGFPAAVCEYASIER
ncbi:hypothetical protein [Micromonospora sp.]|uniref:hypothetical protein n=1 Tax=Micromonospora sp. TaxID=1876 RepID=UPI003B3A1983